MSPDTTPTPLARALGRIPCGLYVVTTLLEGRPAGFIGSFVMQTGFEPPTICVAFGKQRGPLAGVRACGHFALSVLDDGGRGLMSRFFKSYPPGESALDGLALRPTAGDVPVLEDALAWMGCRVTGEHDCGDHVVVFGEVVEGGLAREGDPAVHLRKNGLSY